MKWVVYHYDALGNRREEEVWLRSGNDLVLYHRWRFGYDRGRVWADLEGAGQANTLLTRYVRDENGNLLARILPVGMAWYLLDRLGSTHVVVDQNGHAIDWITYTAFGEAQEAASQYDDRFKYKGREYDPFTNLQHVGGRYYDQNIGRWITQVPGGVLRNGTNLYIENGNDPTEVTGGSFGAGHGTAAEQGRGVMDYLGYAVAASGPIGAAAMMYGAPGWWERNVSQPVANQLIAVENWWTKDGAPATRKFFQDAVNPDSFGAESGFGALLNDLYYVVNPWALESKLARLAWQTAALDAKIADARNSLPNYDPQGGSGTAALFQSVASGYWQGLGHGGVMLANNALSIVTLGHSPLQGYVDKLVDQNGLVYSVANMSGRVGLEALVLAATLGSGSIVNAARAGEAYQGSRGLLWASRAAQPIFAARDAWTTGVSIGEGINESRAGNPLGAGFHFTLAALGAFGMVASGSQTAGLIEDAIAARRAARAASQVGAGGIGNLAYKTESLSTAVTNQCVNGSCQAANAVTILRQAGVNVTEAQILQRAPIVRGLKFTLPEDIATALNELHPNLVWQAGGIERGALQLMSRRGPFMATVGHHSVIVTKVEGGTVHLMDPWGAGPGTGSGTLGTMNESDFLQVWFGNGIFPSGAK